MVLRVPREAPPRVRQRRDRGAAKPPSAAQLDTAAQQRFAALRAWRAEVAREHNLPAYVVFHDATLAHMASERPTSLEALSRLSGVGAKKLDAYGSDILRVLAGD